jgi:hypothetical protein
MERIPIVGERSPPLLRERYPAEAPFGMFHMARSRIPTAAIAAPVSERPSQRPARHLTLPPGRGQVLSIINALATAGSTDSRGLNRSDRRHSCNGSHPCWYLGVPGRAHPVRRCHKPFDTPSGAPTDHVQRTFQLKLLASALANAAIAFCDGGHIANRSHGTVMAVVMERRRAQPKAAIAAQ